MNTASQHDTYKIYLIVFLGFLFGLASALLAFVMSSYFQQAIDSDNVGIFFMVSSLVSLIVLLHLHKIFAAYGRGRTLVALLFLQVVTMFFLTMSDVALFGAILLTFYYMLFGVIATLWDVVLEAYSSDTQTGRIRGLYLSVTSLGWVVGPFLSMTALEHFGFHVLLFSVFVLYIAMFMLTLVALNDVRGHNKKEHVAIFTTLKTMYKNAKLWYIYWIATTLRFFYAIMTIFIPLHMRTLGFTWGEMGLMFTMMLLPFILLQYPAGVLADKKWGEKELLFVGFVILIIASVMVLIVEQPLFWLWAGILIFSRVGAALIESMRDTYFYKQVDGQDTNLIGFLRTSRPVAFISAAGLAAIMNLFFDVRAVFVLLIIVLVIGLYPVFRLEDTHPE